MRLPPLDVIESWPKPNYVNPESKAGILLATEITITVVMFLVVVLRIYTRLRISKYENLVLVGSSFAHAADILGNRCWGLDDWFIIPSTVCDYPQGFDARPLCTDRVQLGALGYTTTSCIATNYGWCKILAHGLGNVSHLS